MYCTQSLLSLEFIPVEGDDARFRASWVLIRTELTYRFNGKTNVFRNLCCPEACWSRFKSWVSVAEAAAEIRRHYFLGWGVVPDAH